MDLEAMVGEVLAGRFKLESLLGQGGYGAVFKATQLSMRRSCAVKVLHERLLGDAMASERFRSEAIATSKLQQANSVIIYDFGEDEERDLLFIAMEYLEGDSLNDLIKKRGRLSVEDSVHIVSQMAASLQDAHDNGIIHRDIKPHNAMVMRRGKDPHFIKVIDFGIAKLLQEATLTPLEAVTQTGVMIGTPHYMAPEQIRGQEVDGRTDQYALANCLYKMLLGHTPLQGNTPVDVAVQQLTETPKPLRAFDASLPVTDSFERVLLRGLAKEMDDRYPRITDFTQALKESLKGRATVPIDISGYDLPTPGVVEAEDALDETVGQPAVAATGPVAFDPMTGEPIRKRIEGAAFAPTAESRSPVEAPAPADVSTPTPIGQGVTIGEREGLDESSDGHTVVARTPGDTSASAPVASGAEATSAIPEPIHAPMPGPQESTFDAPAPSAPSRVPLLVGGLVLSLLLFAGLAAFVVNMDRDSAPGGEATPAVAAKETTPIAPMKSADEATPAAASDTSPEPVEDVSIKVDIEGEGTLHVDAREVTLSPEGTVTVPSGVRLFSVRVGKEIYEEKSIEVGDRGPRAITLKGKLEQRAPERAEKPAAIEPARVTLVVRGEGEVTRDGAPVSGREVELVPGTYLFAVRHDGKEIDREKVELRAGQKKRLELSGYVAKKKAEPVARVYASVPVTIIPGGELLVDGKKTRVDGSRKAKVLVGSRKFKVRFHDGHMSDVRTVSVSDGKNPRQVFKR